MTKCRTKTWIILCITVIANVLLTAPAKDIIQNIELPPLPVAIPSNNHDTITAHMEKKPINTTELNNTAIDKRLDQAYSQALNMLGAGHTLAAIQSLQTILIQKPFHQKARETLAFLWLEQGFPAKTHEVLRAGLQQDAHDVTLLLIQARAFLAENNITHAIASLEGHPVSLPLFPDYYGFLANLYQQEGYFNEAQTTYQALLQLDEQRGQWWLGLAIAQEYLEQNASALQSYQHAQYDSSLSTAVRYYIADRIIHLQKTTPE